MAIVGYQVSIKKSWLSSCSSLHFRAVFLALISEGCRQFMIIITIIIHHQDYHHHHYHHHDYHHRHQRPFGIFRRRVMTIHGSMDEMIPVEDSNHFAKLIPNHTLHIIEGADHGYNHQAELALLVLDFIKSNPVKQNPCDIFQKIPIFLLMFLRKNPLLLFSHFVIRFA